MYKVKFDTGETITFDKQPTDKDIEDVVKKLGIKPKTATIPEQPKENKSLLSKIGAGITDFATGVQKGAAKTAFNVGSLGLRAVTYPIKNVEVPGLGGAKVSDLTKVPESISQELKPTTTVQKVGFVAEQIGEFLTPVGIETKGLSILQKAIPNLDKASKISQVLAKGLVKATSSAAEFGGKTLLQTGGDTNQAIDSALIGFLVPPVGTVAKKTLGLVTKVLPEKLYSQIFKTASEDLEKYYQTVARGEKVNPTLAREALERGLKGNSKNMAVYSIKKLDTLEQTVQDTIKAKKLEGVKIVLDNKKGYLNILQTVKDQFKNGFLSGRSKEADTLIKQLNSTKGKEIDVDLTLKIRRFIDRMRNTSSFKLDPKLTPRQEEFKTATDLLRGKLADAGLKDLMNEERVFIEVIDSIVSDAAKRNNKNILNLTDVILGGGGLASGFPGAGLGTAAAVRVFQQPVTLTNLAQILFKSGNAIESVIPFLKQIPKAIPPLMQK